MTKPRQYHYGGVPRTSLQSTINDTDELGLIIAIGPSEAPNWPTLGPFVVRLERGTPREEAFLVSGRSGANLMVTERGYDETPRVAHTAGSAVFVEHTFDGNWPNTVDSILALPTAAGDLVVTNGTEYVRVPVGLPAQVLRTDPTQPVGLRWGVSPVADMVMAAGDLLYGAGVDTLARLPIGTDGMPLVSAAGLPAWTTMSGAYITDDTIEGSKISSGTIGTTHLIDGAVTGPKIAPGAVGPTQLAPAATAGVVDLDHDGLYVADSTTPTNIFSLTAPAGSQPGTIYDLEAWGWLLNQSGARRYYYLRLGHIGNYTEYLVSATNQAGYYHWHITQRFVVVSATAYRVFSRYEHAARDPGDTTDAATMVEDGSLTSPYQFRPTVQWSGTQGTTANLALPLTFACQAQLNSADPDQSITCLSAQLTRITS